MSEPPRVSIIVITLNTPRMTAACLRSVVKNSSVPYELIVINNSRARPIHRRLRRFPQARVIQNEENAGFSRAANQGMLAARGEYLCLLNSDTLVPPGWLERLIEAAREPGAGAVGPASNELKKRERRPEGCLESVPFLNGFCLLLPRVVVACMGLFDEGYFFGLEDVDYCLQLRLRGYRLLRTHSVFVRHLKGASSSPERRRRLVTRSEAHFMMKWTTPLDPPELDFYGLLRRLNTEIPVRKNPPGPATPPGLAAGRRSLTSPRLIRRGFLASAYGRTALIRFSDLGVFASSPDINRAWNRMRGGRDIKKSMGKAPRDTRRRVEELIRRGLVGEIRPTPPSRCLVTVMMAAHRTERWIDQAIESILAQRFTDFELIIADDGSLDGTARIVREYSWHPRIRLIANPVQRGVSATRNRILREARGEFIAVCDSDDIALPDFLPRFASFLQRHPRVGWVYADRMGILPDGNRCNELYPARPPDGTAEFRANVIAHAGAMIRRKAMEEAGGYDESLLCTEDYDLALKIARKWSIAALPGEAHYLWRQHPKSHSRVSPWSLRETDRLIRLAKRHPPRA